jgi:hypothetical protein
MKKFVLVVCLFAFASLSFAQRQISDDTPKTFKERGYFGGGFGLNSGSINGVNYFYFGVSPIIGYMITPQLSAGTGLSWNRTSYSDSRGTVLNQYGISPFVRYNFNQLFAYGEYNYISTPTLISTQTRTFNRMLLGLGYTQSIGGRGAINAVALYDVLYDQSEGAFASPWVFRVFFSF